MIEETGRVVAVEEGAVWVETIRQASCQSCSARSGCGHSALAKLGRSVHIRAGATQPYAVGDDVVIGVPETVVVSSSLLAYLMPLLIALGFALVADHLSGSDGWAALAGAAGLATGFMALRWHFSRNQHDQRYQPVVLRRAALTVPGRTEYSP